MVLSSSVVWFWIVAGTNTNGLIDPDSGFCLRTKIPLPSPSQFLSVTQFTLSLSPSSPATTFLINASRTLTSSVKSNSFSFDFSLQNWRHLHPRPKLRVDISPANPRGSHQISLTTFKSASLESTSPRHNSHVSHSRKLSPNLPTIPIDSLEFLSLLSTQRQNDDVSFTYSSPPAVVNQSDSAAILYSSGTTKKVKDVLSTHQNVLVSIAEFCYSFSNRIGVTDASSVPLFRLFRVGEGGCRGPDLGFHQVVWFWNNVDGCRQV